MSASFFLVQAAASTVVLLLAAVICLALRRGSAAQRHFVWLLAFASLLIVPAAAWLMPPVLPKLMPARATPQVIVTVGSSEPAATAAPSLPAAPQGVPLSTLFGGLWIAGTAVLTIRTAAGLMLCARRRRRSETLERVNTACRQLASDLGLGRIIDVRLSSHVSTPETFGLLQPAILLPPASAEWTQERLRIVLLHELIHIQRHDWAVHFMARLAVSVFWFNPLSWYALARLQNEREQACDDDVLRFGIAHSDYASELVDIARTIRADPPSLAVAMARPAHLEGRIRAILDPQLNRRRLTLKNKIFALVPAMLVMATASLVTAPAQTGAATVSGTVRDPSGAVIPDANVVMTDGKGQETVRTDDVGKFSFTGVPEGKYTLKVAQPGFRAFAKDDVTVKAGAPIAVDVTLDIGRLSETVAVTAKGYARPQFATHMSSFKYSLDGDRAPKVQAPTRKAEPASGPGPRRIRVGGNIRPAKLVNHTKPEYPQHLVSSGVEGTVLLQAVVGTNGEMLSVEVRNSQVDPDLIKAAMEAVKQWRYEPTLLNGQPVEVITSITVEFRLKS
jgi:TonB family protein